MEKMAIKKGLDPTVRKNLTAFVLVTTYCSTFYFLTNYFPSKAPALLPVFSFESDLEVMPWTAWIYISYFLLVLYSGIRLSRSFWFSRGALAIAALITISGVTFLIFPTTIMRPEYSSLAPSAWVLEIVRAVDPPNNCFPSLHVGLVVSCSLLVFLENRWEGLLIMIWSAIIAISTLTTKQHYFLDVLAGLGLALLLFSIFLGSGLLKHRQTR